MGKEGKKFVIQFSGLKEKVHKFEYILEETFFSEFENQEVQSGKVNADISLDKRANMMVLEFDMQGYVDITCDRCGSNLQQSISNPYRLIVKFGKEKYQETEEILVLSEEALEINLKDILNEFVILSVPAKREHEESKCDPEALDILKDLSERKEVTNDPRWDALKKLK